jgi:hypothetical protein
MAAFGDRYLEIRSMLGDPEAFYSKFSSHLDPNLVDRLGAYAVSRNMPLAETVLIALELFMLSVAEGAWAELARGQDLNLFSTAPMSFILEQFLTNDRYTSSQRLIEGPEPPSILNQFCRMIAEADVNVDRSR